MSTQTEDKFIAALAMAFVVLVISLTTGCRAEDPRAPADCTAVVTAWCEHRSACLRSSSTVPVEPCVEDWLPACEALAAMPDAAAEQYPEASAAFSQGCLDALLAGEVSCRADEWPAECRP